jgi:hypothetical protein
VPTAVSNLVHVYAVEDEVGRDICSVSIVAGDIMEARAAMDSFALDYGLVRRGLRHGSYGEIDLDRCVTPRWTAPPSKRRRGREVRATTYWTAAIWFDRVETPMQSEHDAYRHGEADRVMVNPRRSSSGETLPAHPYTPWCHVIGCLPL